MHKTLKRSTIYFEPQLHEALRIKGIQSKSSLSKLVNEAVKNALAEDQEDLAAFEERASEPVLSYQELLDHLKANDKI